MIKSDFDEMYIRLSRDEFWDWIEKYIKEQKTEIKKEFLEKIIQDMFDASALSLPLEYIYDLKKELEAA